MRIEKTTFEDRDVVVAVLKRLTQKKLKQYVGVDALEYRWTGVLEHHGWGGVYRGMEHGGTETTPDELLVNIFLSEREVEQAVLEDMKKKHPTFFATFPKEWEVKITLGYRDSYGSITIWAEG